ncbi:MAG: hypothetical protein GY880_16215, partial [Planctomycetaceae bacterium]|nr:hypothetical protein [Planctomycetaceae bacterium]
MKILVVFVVFLGWTWASSASAVEPVKSAGKRTGEPLSLQASEQVGEAVGSGGGAELETRRLIRNRIAGLAIVFSGLLLLLGLSFMYLRLDHATRGFHSGRLQLLAVFLGLAIVG